MSPAVGKGTHLLEPGRGNGERRPGHTERRLVEGAVGPPSRSPRHRPPIERTLRRALQQHREMAIKRGQQYDVDRETKGAYRLGCDAISHLAI